MVAADAADVIAPPPPVQADMDLASETAIGAQKIEKQMHVFNAWLPHFMVAEVKEEPQRFHKLVATMREEMLCFTCPADRVATLAWIPVINSYVSLFFNYYYSSELVVYPLIYFLAVLFVLGTKTGVRSLQ